MPPADAAVDAAATPGELLGADGPFASRLDGFRARVEQQEMADAIAEVMAAREVLVCEAGTGTGKTLAYLVPALSSGLRTILSTATKTLQDQLFHRDLPLVRAALQRRIDVALLKGRQNYLCLHRLDRALNDAFTDHRRTPRLLHLRQWSERTKSGDLEEVDLLDDDPQGRFQVTSTAENCLGQECPVYERCFVVKARRAAAAADIVVVNHHLLFADMVLRDTGFGELLPDAEAVVLDEAHKLPDIASVFFSRAISAQQLAAFARDAHAAVALDAPDTPALVALLDDLQRAERGLRDQLEGNAQRPDWLQLRERPPVAAAIAAVGSALDAVADGFAAVDERGPELDNCAARGALLLERWQTFDAPAASGHVHWIEIGPRNFTLYDTPVSVAAEFSERVNQSQAAWIMTSATLAIDGRFEHFTRALGLAGAHERLWASPFDFAHNALLYLPPMRAEPRDEQFEPELVAACLPVLQASAGRAFFLFTSYRALHRVADLLAANCDFPLLIQGEHPRSELLRRFSTTPHAVLLGTASFWEGVDVRGEQLSCVIIDKLPFGVPDDPVMRARVEALAEAGGNPFVELQLPEAITTLKQGAGRLIRDVTDRGVLVIGDRRITSKGYGRAFLNSLPPMARSSEITDVTAFFADDAQRC